MTSVDMAKVRTLITFIGTVLAGRTAIERIRQARDDDDRLELFDAVLNMAVVLTGVLVIVRRLRRGEEA
jgi:hypothetical protein